MITLESLLLAASVPIAAGILTSLVDVLLRVAPRLDGMIVTFIASFVLFVLVFVQVADYTLNGAFACFLAWLAVATSALGIHKAVLGPLGVSDAIQGTK